MLNEESFPQIVNKNARYVLTKLLKLQSFATRLAQAPPSFFFFFSSKNAKKNVMIKMRKEKVVKRQAGC